MIVKPTIEKVHKSKKNKLEKAKSKWWLEPDDSLFISVFSIVNRQNSKQNNRHLNNIKFARMYENLDVTSYALGFYDSQLTTAAINLPTYNVVKSCIDTVANKITKSNPKIQFLTEDGDWGMQERAKNLTQYTEGLFDLTDSWGVGKEVFKDAEKFGTGCAFSYITEDNNIEVERVLISEIIVDDGEGIYRKPRQIHRRKLIQRDVLKDMFPEFIHQIEGAKAIDFNSANALVPPDMVQVVESWHLKSGPNATDGKHAICIENATLYSEDYTKKKFPFVFYRWSTKTVGFFGAGLAEELSGLQIEINKLMRFIRIAQERMAVPRIFMEAGEGLSRDQVLSNTIGDVVTYPIGVNPPVFIAPSAVAQEIYQYLETLKKNCYEISGVSQLSAMSQKPSGLNSGTALETYQQIESERFILAGEEYQKFFIELAELLIDMSKDLYQDKHNITVKVVGSKFVKNISWDEVNMEEDQYSMRGFPVSLLPSTPEGKLQKVTDLIQAGLIPKEYGLSLLSFPDLDKVISLETAAYDDIMMLISQMLNDGVYTSPEPYMNLDLALTLSHSAYLNAKTKKGIKPGNIELLRTFQNDILTLQEIANPPPPPVVPPIVGQVGIAPPGAPVAQPTSDLIPAQGSQAPVLQ